MVNAKLMRYNVELRQWNITEDILYQMFLILISIVKIRKQGKD